MVVLILVLLVVFIMEKDVLKSVDYCLLLTFICFLFSRGIWKYSCGKRYIAKFDNRSGTCYKRFCKSSHKQCPSGAFIVRIYGQLPGIVERCEYRRPWDFDCVNGEFDIL